MIIRLIIALTCMCLLGTSCSSSDDRDARPLRADCIVRIYFDPSEGVRDVSPDAIFYAHYNLGLPVGGVARAKNGDIYVQFEQNCESRGGHGAFHDGAGIRTLRGRHKLSRGRKSSWAGYDQRSR